MDDTSRLSTASETLLLRPVRGSCAGCSPGLSCRARAVVEGPGTLQLGDGCRLPRLALGVVFAPGGALVRHPRGAGGIGSLRGVGAILLRHLGNEGPRDAGAARNHR